MKAYLAMAAITTMVALDACNAGTAPPPAMPPMVGGGMASGMGCGMMSGAAGSAAHVAPAGAGARTGAQVFQTVCATCHATGMLNAPRMGDKAAWGPRIAKGMPALLRSATDGVRAMPARGGDPTLTKAELAAAVAYMAGKP